MSPHWWCAALTCISRILESHHNHCCKELRNIFISYPQLNVEAHNYLAHRGWAVEIRHHSILLWLHSYWQNLHPGSISAFSYNAKMGIKNISIPTSGIWLHKGVTFILEIAAEIPLHGHFPCDLPKRGVHDQRSSRGDLTVWQEMPYTLPESILKECGSCWLSPPGEKKTPLLLLPWEGMVLLRNPCPAHAMITISICRLLGRLSCVLNQEQHYSLTESNSSIPFRNCNL